MALWILPKRGLLCVGAKANVPLCGGKKLNKKMCGREKKKYRRVGKVCRLSSCPFVIWSVCLCLSVKMVYASLVCLTVTVRVARPLSLRLQLTFCAQPPFFQWRLCAVSTSFITRLSISSILRIQVFLINQVRSLWPI
jgi:hypothetical protein